MANRMISYGYGMESGKLVVIDSEAEIVRIYCRAKKMLPAPPPRMAGTMSGVSVLYQPMRT